MDGLGVCIFYRAILANCLWMALYRANHRCSPHQYHFLCGNYIWQHSVAFPAVISKGAYYLSIYSGNYIIAFNRATKGVLSMFIYNAFFAMGHPTEMKPRPIISFYNCRSFNFMLSFIFRIALAYFTLKQQSEEIIAQKTQAELNLLKIAGAAAFPVQYAQQYLLRSLPGSAPHSILNRTLSDIMRYFVDESPKQEVSLATEIQFLENYIALENIRIRYEIDITFTKIAILLSLPPMLLITFVENIFKHGIDKSSSHNKIDISLVQQNGRLIFTTTNTVPRISR
jgi:hypothetical protein